MKTALALIAMAILALTVPLFFGPGSTHDVKRRVSAALIDPDSAIFNDIHHGDYQACGFVNAKNRMGGYIGKKRFVTVRHVTDNNPLLTDFEPGHAGVLSDFFEKSWDECRSENLSLIENYKRAWVTWLALDIK